MRKKVGTQVEELAVQYLRQKGYRILDRNYYSRYGEIDVICERDRDIIFVEVKTRRSDRFGSAEESVTPAKQQRLRKTALYYLQQRDQPFRELRFDVITVRLGERDPVINHIKNAF